MGIVERLREHNEPPFDYIAHEAAEEIVKLREVLEPFAKKYLWPDDSGYADELRADEDWSEVRNDDTLDSCLIQRKWIRDAREALREKE